ncbi:MAG: class I SAM-dependent methyltransferase [Emcibacteraceae bacterium]|nr:class I SAM-dependent methyltransferase [Emcibacteraceae bacterium]
MITEQELVNFMNVESKEIGGWFFPADILSFYLLDRIQRSKNMAGSICEVGVWEAKSLTLLSKFLESGEIAFGYDLFPDDVEDKARKNLQKYGNYDQTTLIKSNTSDLTLEKIATDLSDGVRILHIDAGHDYHEVLHQMVLFTPFVKQGGIVIMDDYQDREFPGIEAAVLDFAERDRPRRIVPFFAGGNKMYLCEQHYASIYQTALLQAEALKDKSRISRVRDFNVLVGFSKLPVSAAACLSSIEKTNFPLGYDDDEQELAAKSARYQQYQFGSGVTK